MKKINIKQVNDAYYNAELEAYIKSKDESFRMQARLLGKSLAIQDSNGQSNSLSIMTECLKSSYNVLNAEAHMQNEGFLNIGLGKIEIEAEILVQEKLIIAIRQAKIAVETEQTRLGPIEVPTVSYSELVVGVLLAAFIITLDAILFGVAFQIGHTGFIVSLILGFGVAITLALISSFGSHRIQQIQNVKWRRVSLIALIVITTSAVGVMCEMRDRYYQAQNIPNGVGTVQLGVLSLTTIVGFHLIYVFIILPVIKKRKEKKMALDALKGLNLLKVEQMQLENLLKESIQKVENVKKLRLSITAYAKSMEKTIVQMYRHSIGIFKRVFILERGYAPEYFSQPTPELDTYYADLNILPKIKDYENS
jgi:hypothetical protein